MAAEIAVRAQGLGKKYVLGHKSGSNKGYSLREIVALNMRGLATSLRHKFFGEQRAFEQRSEEFWAIRGIDFEIRRGEVVGIIGRNGAGKSTLLKILSRITDPTEGRVEIRGRVASLLEVGTGFHPDLTGRENVFLNGAVLGMSRAEIRRKFDEIVAFADVERFIDTPVKRYSSGMYVRLAFAVAAHLEPEILIVDEVLAVGDAEFQRKCLGKMHDVAGLGRTVLFVSHNMAAVEQLCSHALLLELGHLKSGGQVRKVISEYLAGSGAEVLEHIPKSDPSRVVEIRRIAMCNELGVPVSQITIADTPVVKIELLLRERRPDLKLAFALSDSHQTPIFASCPPDAGIDYPTDPGFHEFQIALPGPILMPGRYSVTVSAYSRWSEVFHNCAHALLFDAQPAATSIYSAEPNRVGVMQLACQWKHNSTPADR
jgi:homopolymeric O-antigen transport system ATP-binding protein